MDCRVSKSRRCSGCFRFGFTGHTGNIGTRWAWLSFLFAATRALVKSPFGLALLGARENPRRMLTLGAPVEGDICKAFFIAAALAGAAGAVLTQTTQNGGADLSLLPALGRRFWSSSSSAARGRPLRRLHWRHRLHPAAGLRLGDEPGLLVFLDRPPAGRDRVVLPQGAASDCRRADCRSGQSARAIQDHPHERADPRNPANVHGVRRPS